MKRGYEKGVMEPVKDSAAAIWINLAPATFSWARRYRKTSPDLQRRPIAVKRTCHPLPARSETRAGTRDVAATRSTSLPKPTDMHPLGSYHWASLEILWESEMGRPGRVIFKEWKQEPILIITWPSPSAHHRGFWSGNCLTMVSWV